MSTIPAQRTPHDVPAGTRVRLIETGQLGAVVSESMGVTAGPDVAGRWLVPVQWDPAAGVKRCSFAMPEELEIVR